MQGYRPHTGKEYVKVRADCGLDGSIRPLKFRPENGPAVVIDRILDVRQTPRAEGGRPGHALYLPDSGAHLLSVLRQVAVVYRDGLTEAWTCADATTWKSGIPGRIC